MSQLYSAKAVVSWLCLVLLAPTLSSHALAQAAGEGPTCATVLTSDAITKSVGEAFRDDGMERSRSGTTTCEWASKRGTSGVKAISVTFLGTAALTANPASSSPDAYFDTVVSAGDPSGKIKREELAGIGTKAIFVSKPPFGFVTVKRADGVVSLTGMNLTKAQITALARAAAAP